MQPKHPVYIVSKGRADSRLTVKMLDRMRVPYLIVVEQQEFGQYAAVIDRSKILVLDPSYQRGYDTCDDAGETKSKGPGPARNFVWDHAIAGDHDWHWVLDDNIRDILRFHRNAKIPVWDGTAFRVMEDFVERYDNLAMAGPTYRGFVSQRDRNPTIVFNTRIYSCNLIRNDVPFRWRARYNEDTDISLRMLKAGWCTVQFKTFLQDKQRTQSMRGGNTDDFYAKEGTLPKSEMLAWLHPDVCRVTWKYNRWHHHCDYRPFRGNRLRLRDGVTIPIESNEYGMRLVRVGAVG